MSLSQLWQQQGERYKARQLLADIYGWFIERFERLSGNKGFEKQYFVSRPGQD